MHLWALIFLFLNHLNDVPKRICLPIQISQNSPIEFALRSVREELASHSDRIEISCSQPDFQLFFTIDKSLKNRDDFILIISDVNIEISGGSDRGAMYGILEFLHQLRACNYVISDVRSVVSHPDVNIRGLRIDHQYLAAMGHDQDLTSFFDEMVALRFNHLIIFRKKPDEEMVKPLDREFVDELQHLAQIRNIGFEVQDFSTDTLSRKGLEINSGLVSRSHSSRTVFRLRNKLSDFERLSKIREYPTIIIDLDDRQIHNFSSRLQQQWWRIFTNRKSVPQKVILDCTGMRFSSAASPDFLVRNHRYFSNWSQQLERPLSFAPLHPIVRVYPCFSRALTQSVQAAESAGSLLNDFIGSEEYWFDWRTFQRLDKLDQGHFYGVEEMYDDFNERDVFRAEAKTANGFSFSTMLDSLKTLQMMIKNHSVQNCNQLELEFILMDLEEFATCLSYSIHKFESVMQLARYASTRKRNDKLQAISQINFANEIWSKRWPNKEVKDNSNAAFRPNWNNERKRDLEVIKKFRN